MNPQDATTSNLQRSILLVPWDPDSHVQVKRLEQQRIACGWKIEKVPDWQRYQQAGQLAFYWIVLPASYPDMTTLIQSHLARYPDQTGHLRDTCQSVLNSERDPDASEFYPVGHVCLDGCVENHKDNTLMISPTNGIYTIAAFYVSHVMQGTGIGSIAMATLEKLAAEKYGAKTLTLDTLSNEDTDPDSPRMMALGRDTPKVPIYDWYTRRGYVVYRIVKDGVENIDPTGKKWYSTLLYMRKDIS